MQLGIDTERFKAVAHDAQLRTLEQLRKIRRLETGKGKMEREGNIDSALTLSALLNPDRGGGGGAGGATPPIISHYKRLTRLSIAVELASIQRRYLAYYLV